jgi:hypothetical protein
VNVLLITHALNNESKDYSQFFDTIKSNCQQWWHYFNTTWIVTTHLSADQFAKLLYPYMLTDDRLLVVKLQKDYQGWLEKDAWDWLNDKSFF